MNQLEIAFSNLEIVEKSHHFDMRLPFLFFIVISLKIFLFSKIMGMSLQRSRSLRKNQHPLRQINIFIEELISRNIFDHERVFYVVVVFQCAAKAF